ncbi:oxidoreductase FAD/NAD(P)-binding subunit [Alcaligenes faecalis subsp. faecalis NCIB 8687]|jgi:ferredoxin-NAD(P)+ reductase (naphthalene dioxygenase ferredoxin-specific)|uniref:2Fe-2S iron-sulfur cluster binding domain-containing protein n=2 Tax=Alcaligenes TaxID=507 RepID=A0ABX8SPI4_9BURK|nr:2Fe-2S iron-sulfur cluster-binding protein [Alcaligenes ammonioxydans]AAQ19820.1 putative naphthalene 1,2-dioxygenase system ferredoxin-NAD(+) reductase [Alcaligenes faecalis subsp. faecalis NCIB 8687]EJC61942.1 oxidoreductase FAD/NAD(P)-binding subunit [Alcaligenes faecalis subsp. faecalis NCIB 8687]QXX77936.1 2Fe-2S iron-sulfur cluster binding domain-containing protein [Alcaligenes ammonioxydans]WGQ35987.1 2Fe-2S iron-sulfur cluster-binding protein [Alcaligenes faecalis]
MSSKTIIIRQTGTQFDAQEGQNILQAALENGIVYPYGCRQGRCGGCKTRLVQGQVDLLDYSRFALTEAQSARGLILACRAIPRSDVTLDWIGTDDVRGRVPLRQVEGTVVTLEALTHDIRRVRIRLADEQPLMFFAGQYADIKFGQAPARSYCMANRPGEAELEFHIRRVPGGVASAYVHTVLEPGERVTLELPKGTSYLREGHGGPMLCIAGGAGLAPIKSIVETALASGMSQAIHVYFGVREGRDLYGLEEFRALARDYPTLLFTPVVSGIPVAHCSRGLVTDIAGSEQADLRGWKVYVAGSPTLVDATIGMALKRGLKIQDLHAQIYVTP